MEFDFTQIFDSQIATNIIASVSTVGIVAALALALKPLRKVILYRTHEYVLGHRSTSERCVWDIQWERERLTIETKDVHNNYLESVTIRYLDEAPGVTFDHLNVSSDNLQTPKNWPIQIQLSSIVRTKSDEDREYQVHFIISRRRW